MPEAKWRRSMSLTDPLVDPPGRPRLKAAFYQAKGFYAAGDQTLGRFLDEIMQPSLDLAATGPLFRVRMEEIYRQARERISGSALKILTVGTGEFRIGDVPALTIRHDCPRPGVLADITLSDAHTVIMPLGPPPRGAREDEPHRRTDTGPGRQRQRLPGQRRCRVRLLPAQQRA
jgi:hypothetical protein